jgi:Family of unknown function (DUF5947)
VSDPVPAQALAVLARIRSNRRPPPPGERCEMCAEPIADTHSHVVDLHTRSLMCTCRGCYLLFTDQQAQLRHRAVPDRYLRFPDTAVTQAEWDGLEIPVGLAFFFSNSDQDRVVAFYPGPAGAAESQLPLGGWQDLITVHPELNVALPDVEAVLVRAPTPDRAAECFLVPIDACYQLVGTLRQRWQGFDGGPEAREEIERFFTTVRQRSRPAPATPPGASGVPV